MTLLSFEAALELVVRDVEPLSCESVPLDAADGRVLAEDLFATRAMPDSDHSAMDGYALASSDLTDDGPWRLPVRGESRAGGPLPRFEPGTVCRIFTGAALPIGADTVVMQERARRDGDSLVLESDARPSPRQNVRSRGEDLAEGALALHRGTRLGPAHLGVAATLDRAILPVARRPRVAILATGDELRVPGTPHRPGTIAESNAYVLGALARRAAATCEVLPFVGDATDALERALLDVQSRADLVLTVGGASVGDHDLVRPVLHRLNATFSFSGVSMRPGKPTSFARLGGTRVLCLPGNPASATLAMLLYGVPLLRALQGDDRARPRFERLPVLGSVSRRLGGSCDGRDDFLRARIETVDGAPHARLAERQSSGAVTSFSEADALVRLSGLVERVRDGDTMPTYRLADLGG